MSELSALQAALAGEHAAVWAYGVVGARLPAAQRPRALADLAAHRRARDLLQARLRARGATPVAPDPAYLLPFAVPDRGAALRLAAFVEHRLAADYVALLGATADRPGRAAALAALTATATREAGWRLTAGLPPDGPFPGDPAPA